jgi:hypothetical protein
MYILVLDAILIGKVHTSPIHYIADAACPPDEILTKS